MLRAVRFLELEDRVRFNLEIAKLVDFGPSKLVLAFQPAYCPVVASAGFFDFAEPVVAHGQKKHIVSGCLTVGFYDGAL